MKRSDVQRGPKRLAAEPHQALSQPVFGVLAIVLGVVAGLGAYGFRLLIALVHNLAFLGRLSLVYDSNAHTPPAPWGPWVVLVPVAGALVVAPLVRHLAPEAKGHGVPEVMDAIYYQRSEIRPIVAVVKSIASALSIGTGGSAGREGPIVQIGAAFGSFCGRLDRVSRWQRATLVAAGGGAGIAATFNTPLGGVLFALEILLHEVSVRTLVPVALATTTATYVARWLFGNHPAFPVPAMEPSGSVASLPAYVALGALTAAASVAFIRALYGAEDWFERVFPDRPYVRHAVGMLFVGCLIAALARWTGHYHVQGVGYATIVDVLHAPPAAGFLLVLCLLKLAATSATLGSGASGGVFSPSLFMGATLGAAFGSLVTTVLPVNPAVFALAGMAGMLAGSTGAVLTAVVMIFEMTLDYSVVLPLVLTASVSYGLRRMLLAESIYTLKLARRGHVMPEALQANAHLVHHVAELALDGVALMPADAGPEQLAARAAGISTASHVVLVEGEQVAGVLLPEEWCRLASRCPNDGRCLAELAETDYVLVPGDATIFDLLSRMQRCRASVAVVTAPGAPSANEPASLLGVVTKVHIAEVLADGMELFQD